MSTLEIFPAIGIARVGKSSDFFVGPESDQPPDLRRRDANGNLLRQAARFRIYECDRDAAGKLIAAAEITSAQAIIEWSVHLVNRKAAAENFRNGRPDGTRRNNAAGNDAIDRDLIVDPGTKRIRSGDTTVKLDGGKFRNKPVSLGSLNVEVSGRLCVVGGDGTSESSTGVPLNNGDDFADNDNWHDDVGDGPVSARVTRGGQTMTVDKPAWVIVAPPDFAPEITNLITMYDVLSDLAVTRGLLPAASQIFFDTHIRPILARAMGYQWVNEQARLGMGTGGHGPGGAGDFSTSFVALGDPTQPNDDRQDIFDHLRDPDQRPAPTPKQRQMPRLNDHKNSGGVLPLTRQQYRAMKMWAAGNFTAGAQPPPEELTPDGLTRVALEACAGGAFFPGIEAGGKIMTDASKFMPSEAFRLKPTALEPGAVTANNAVPWQADFRLCRWETEEDGVPKNLGWWPAQRPDAVLKNASDRPVSWTRGLPDTYDSMVKQWHRLGFVKQDPANPGVFIEQDRDPTLPP